MFVVFAGTAGSGKSSLVASFSDWIRKEVGLKISVVNLDPGAEALPYQPDFDIRQLFTIREIMQKYGLGPNGAFLKAAELLGEYSREIIRHKVFRSFSDYILIDTPGQLEMFLFRPEGTQFLKKLERLRPVLIVYIVDGSLAPHPEDLLTSYMLSLMLQAKSELQVVTVINKVDLVSEEDMKTIRLLIENPEEFAKSVADKVGGIAGDMIMDLIKIVEMYAPPERAILVSAKTKEGLRELYDLVHEVYCSCGDLT
ncbi:ATP/GTP-binding protein [Ignicoccus hospitalis]|uniref:GTPase n=1 Tax=Ignicoccus hospitalis (strain KIN4/I / DSM 18386 / JCM 14125) TaxID=453591 RepID=A8AAM6_IGNH4|nr:ATP/GTP-binding protein [Ignicoccus hospitalis]ABU81978.1 protein of unknown function, ATP binding [Ignicoccus hospitalis KIN4/I]HIH89863.1 GTPase [Desulfurococcaceae archaeon]